MLDKETLKKKLFEMLDECNTYLIKYKELRSKGLASDQIFEATYNTRKQTISELIELIYGK